MVIAMAMAMAKERGLRDLAKKVGEAGKLWMDRARSVKNKFLEGIQRCLAGWAVGIWTVWVRG